MPRSRAALEHLLRTAYADGLRQGRGETERLEEALARSRRLTALSEPGTLYVVATPIGHLDDLSIRAASVLGVLLLSIRMGVLDEEGLPVYVRPVALVRYVAWLTIEVIVKEHGLPIQSANCQPELIGTIFKG